MGLDYRPLFFSFLAMHSNALKAVSATSYPCLYILFFLCVCGERETERRGEAEVRGRELALHLTFFSTPDLQKPMHGHQFI